MTTKRENELLGKLFNANKTISNLRQILKSILEDYDEYGQLTDDRLNEAECFLKTK